MGRLMSLMVCPFMRWSRHPAFVWPLLACLVLAEGCRMRDKTAFKAVDDNCYPALAATKIENPGVTPCSHNQQDWADDQPLTIASNRHRKYSNHTLE